MFIAKQNTGQYLNQIMAYKKPGSDNDSDIIIIDNPLDTITITEASSEKRKINKKKKQPKRKVQLGVGRDNHMETLLITQKLQVKRTKFCCIINIDDTICKNKQSDSIIRFSKNVCSASAYYERIVPICFRNKCFHVKIDAISKSNRCKLERKKENVEADHRKISGIYSPMSSVVLTEHEKDISYEDVSNGDFHSSSEDELDTLIKRTKEREKQTIDRLKTFPVPLYTSTPMHTNEDVASTYSSASVHSKATLVLTPGMEAYSPTWSPNHITDTYPSHKVMLERIETEEFVKDEYLDPYSPTDPTVTPPRFVFGETDRNPNFITKDSRSSLPLMEVEKENDTDNDLPDFNITEIKNEIVETINCSSLINTEGVSVKRENGNDINANYKVYIKTEQPPNCLD